MDSNPVDRGGRHLIRLVWFAPVVVAMVLPGPAQAQCPHGASIFKTCQSPKRTCALDSDCDDGKECTDDSCDTVALDNHTSCTITLGHADGCGDVTKITEAWDVQDTAGDNVRVPPAGNLPITGTFGNAVCCVGPVLPCFVGPAGDGSTILDAETGCGNLTLPAAGAAGAVSFLQNTYQIQPDDPNPLEDQANVKVKDLCTAGIAGCSTVTSIVQFTAATSLQTGCKNEPLPDSTPCGDTDGNACTTAGCDAAGNCDQAHLVAPQSTPCPDTDGNACTTAGCDATGTCDQAHLVAPPSTPCPDTDGNACTTAGCDAAGTCDQSHIGTPCIGDCLTGACDPDTGDCIPKPESTPCPDTDGNVCTTAGCDAAPACDQRHVVAPPGESCGPHQECNEFGECQEVPFCGDGMVNVAGETCDPPGTPAGGNGNLCRFDCTVCGDKIVDGSAGEQCDDGNGIDGDGCDSNCTGPRDHFKCYRSRQPFQRRIVSLNDQFGPTTATARRQWRFCNPVDKNGEGIHNPLGHLNCYRIREPLPARRDVFMTNQFGTQKLTIRRAETLCLPAVKDGVGNLEDLDLRHYKCYRVSKAPGAPRFTGPDVSLKDQFESRINELIKPRLVCTPVDKNGEEPDAPFDPGHLTCFKIKDAPGQPPFVRVSAEVEDQFVRSTAEPTQRTDCGHSRLLCVPSQKRIASPSGAFLELTGSVLE